MYKLLLILRYLRRKLAPIFAALAVTLCTAMVIVVISVMGGFLDMMRHAARTLTGDITIRADVIGFAHYDRLIAELEKLPGVEAATPVVQAYGLVKVQGSVRTIEVIGIEPRKFHEVMLRRDGATKRLVGFRDTLYWTSDHLLEYIQRTRPSPDNILPEHERALKLEEERYRQLDLRESGMSLTAPPWWPVEPGTPGMIAGIEVPPYAARDDHGRYDVALSSIGQPVTLTVLPLTMAGGVLEPAVRPMVVVNEFKSGLYEVDVNRVYVPFALLQEMLKMDRRESPMFSELGERLPGVHVSEARASQVILRGGEGEPLVPLSQRVREVVRQFNADHPDVPYLEVLTWQQLHATLLGAVEKEKLMVTFLFALISVVAVVMIGVIFYMIVLEKTRDIGTLRALGASRPGVAGIFLGYGLAIGVLGAGLGYALAAAIVWNINDIQEFLAWALNFRMWNPKIYYFDRIPSQLNPVEVAVILVTAVVSSVLGSVIPALLAARLDPVEALRYE